MSKNNRKYEFNSSASIPDIDEILRAASNFDEPEEYDKNSSKKSISESLSESLYMNISKRTNAIRSDELSRLAEVVAVDEETKNAIHEAKIEESTTLSEVPSEETDASSPDNKASESEQTDTSLE